jgi:hypothetical protein
MCLRMSYLSDKVCRRIKLITQQVTNDVLYSCFVWDAGRCAPFWTTAHPSIVSGQTRPLVRY